ncbi:MAG: di-trans,poly-cis-decaprenylcistransferase [Leptospiraceae bacterium]|nr:di-trans,poly-cis-decaprenylcistransferase [Leptospiraceae bacterium]MCP5497558.1 di-trans,poly-cis-decaprenylcistransferase [Leptospiraceae bacterium]
MNMKIIPKHTAVIMDGNGRWATKSGMSRVKGHKQGVYALLELIDLAIEFNLPCVSLYAFSTENWKRPEKEVKAIFFLLTEFFNTYLKSILDKDIRILHSGDKRQIYPDVVKKINKAVELSETNRGLTVNLCIDYGGKSELVRAFNRLFCKLQKQEIQEINEQEIEKELYTYPLPPVDLLIRTGGEKRLSNFLLWQSAYAELYFTDTFWPDFGKDEFINALDWFAHRQRRFGSV